jgi:hypothetical protein
MHRLVSIAAVLPLLVLSATAHARALTDPPTPPQPIWGGTAVEECGWPTTVFVDGCTGTLVHPELVVFAAHCMFFSGGPGPATVAFGESSGAPSRELPTAGCTMFPGWVPDETSFGNDIAFCRLAEPVLDVPIVPILMGCETDVLQPDQAITLVGFGITDRGALGIKHEVVTTINGFEGPEINVGGGGTSSCNGDSGGPAYVQLADGSWRVFGVTSRGVSGSCADPSIYGLLHPHAQWLEDETALDITPCHDADGTWNPTETCAQFPLTPAVGETDWAQGCTSLRLGPPSATCGEPFTEDPGTTGDADTGLDESAGETTAETDPELPGGTAGSGTTSTPDPTTDTTGAPPSSQDDDEDLLVTCTCKTSSSAPLPLLLLLLAPLRPRRRSPRPSAPGSSLEHPARRR